MSNPDFSLAGKVAVVTGGRRGIGRAIALAFAEAGADVALCDVVVEDGLLEGVAEEIRGMGRRSLAIAADTTRKADVDNVVAQVVNQFGTIDILLNNAGVDIPYDFLELPEDIWDKVMSINVKGYFLFAQAVGKKMVEWKKGTIVNIASQFAFRTDMHMGVYAISKAGVVMLTRVLARELGSYGIRANAIAPALTKTELNRHRWTNQEFVDQYVVSVPLGRLGEIEDLIGAALFLASDASRYVTGHTIVIDGGRLA